MAETDYRPEFINPCVFVNNLFIFMLKDVLLCQSAAANHFSLYKL